MSAALALPLEDLESVAGGLQGVTRPGARRRHLQLVPTGLEGLAVELPVDGGMTDARSGALPTAPRSRLRVTRAGRLVATLSVGAILVFTGISVASASMGVAGQVPQVRATVVVAPGQTLSQIAVDQFPQLPVGQAVAHLQLANNLSSNQIHGGQVLNIPVAP